MKPILLFILVSICFITTIQAETVKLANYCSVDIPESFIRENFELEKDNYLVLSSEAYLGHFLNKLDTDELFLKNSIEKLLRKNGIQKFSKFNEEETKCLLKLYTLFISKSLNLLNSTENEVGIVNLYYNQINSPYKTTIELVLSSTLEKRIKTLKDFKVFDIFNNNLSKNTYEKSATLQTLYKETTLTEKSRILKETKNSNNLLRSILALDLELKAYNAKQSLTKLINGNRLKNDPKYKEWEDLVKTIENEDLNIIKISTTLDDYPILSVLETLEWPEDKKCSFFHKIIKPFALYQYSFEKTKYIDRFYSMKLKCAKTLLETEKLYTIGNQKYYSKWCKEEKDQAKCMMYFNPDWITNIRKCSNDSQCSNQTLDGNHLFYYNNKNPKKSDEVSFYTDRIKYFQESLDVIAFPLDAKPICKAQVCKPSFSFCEPIVLFESLIKQFKTQKFNDCKADSECVLKEFRTENVKASLYYAINKDFKDYDDQYISKLYDEAIIDCKRDLGKNYFNTSKIESKYDLQKMHTQCVQNKCEIKAFN